MHSHRYPYALCSMKHKCSLFMIGKILSKLKMANEVNSTVWPKFFYVKGLHYKMDVQKSHLLFPLKLLLKIWSAPKESQFRSEPTVNVLRNIIAT